MSHNAYAGQNSSSQQNFTVDSVRNWISLPYFLHFPLLDCVEYGVF